MIVLSSVFLTQVIGFFAIMGAWEYCDAEYRHEKNFLGKILLAELVRKYKWSGKDCFTMTNILEISPLCDMTRKKMQRIMDFLIEDGYFVLDNGHYKMTKKGKEWKER